MTVSQSLASTDISKWHVGKYKVEKRDAVDVLILNHPKFKCAVSLFGGQILTFRPKDKKDVLWMSEDVRFDGETALRGGIPICWPWFGNHHDGDSMKKSHGFARTSVWKLVKMASNEKRAHLELEFTHSKETLKVFPYQFKLKLFISLSDSLEVQLITKNLDTSPFRFTGALHAYFKVAEIESTSVCSLGGDCLNSVDDGTPIQVQEPFVVSEALDYVFPNNGPIQLQTTDTKRIASMNADSWVVWNPWIEGTQAISDMVQQGFRAMLCIEPAIISKPINLHPQQVFCLDLCIK